MRRSERLFKTAESLRLLTITFVGERMSKQVLMLKGDKDNIKRWVKEYGDDYDTYEELQEALVERGFAIWVNVSQFDGIRTKLVRL